MYKRQIQELSLSGGSNNISGFGSSGITTFLGGIGGNDTIDASTATFPILVNESGSSLGDYLTASTVTGAASTLIGSSVGGNTFTVSSTLGGMAVGGTGSDTLNLSTAGNYTDTLFANDRSIEILQLTSNSAVTLGGNALSAGIATVVGGSGSDTINSSSTLNGGFTKGLFIDTSANTLSASSYTGGVGNDTIKVANATVLNSSTVNGGAGVNILQVAASGSVITGLGNHVSRIQELSLSGGSNNISGFGSSGITTFLGGIGGNDTIDASTATSPVLINESGSSLGLSLIHI